MDHTFRFGAGRPSLDLVRTLRHRGRPGAVEELATPEAWDAWLAGAGWDDLADPAPDRAERARELREQLAVVLAAVVDGAPLDPAALAALNAAAAEPTPAPRLAPHAGLQRVAADPGRAVRSLLARDALELVGAGGVARLRRCADPACRTIFLDASRPGTRRWCAMSGCGARAKKADQRARERAR